MSNSDLPFHLRLDTTVTDSNGNTVYSKSKTFWIDTACAGVTLSKTPDPGSHSALSAIGFTIQATVTGGTANNVDISDTLPTNTGAWSIDADTFTTPCSISIGGTLTCNEASLLTGTYSVHVTSISTVTSCPSVFNTATATVSLGALSGSPATAAETVTCPANTPTTPSVAIAKSTSTPSLAVGSTAVYDVTVTTQNGSDAHSNPVIAAPVDVSDTLPGGTWTISATPPAGSTAFPTACSITGATLTCNEASLTTGTYGVQISRTIVAADCPGPISNAASVTSAGSSVSNSPTPTVGIALTGCTPFVALSKNPDSASVAAGQQLGFTIQAVVAGAQPAQDLVISDLLPANTGLWSLGTDTFSTPCTLTGGLGAQTLACSEASLPAGTYGVDVVSTSDTASCPSVANEATATLGTGNLSGTPADASVSVTCTVVPPVFPPVVTPPTPAPPTVVTVAPPVTGPTAAGCPAPEIAGPDGTCVLGESLVPDPTIVKKADAASVAAGHSIGFTITLTNPGTIATTATISDPLPAAAGLSWSIDRQPVSGPTCAIATGTLTCGPASIPVGAQWVVHITSPTTASSCGKITNTASVSSPNLSAPRTSTASESVTCVLGISQTAPTGASTAPAALPFTGAYVSRLLSAGGAMALLGVLMMVAGRRRTEEESLKSREDPLGRL